MAKKKRTPWERVDLNRAQLYYVDESGDPTIFSRKGKILIGSEGCSRFFILGLLNVGDIASLERDLTQLRTDLLSDPYFKDVPSMQIDQGKTAIAFHANDDLPEVRREVYGLLRKRNDLGFFAVVADKLSTLAYIQSRQSHEASYRYHPSEIYDFLVRILFKNRLHQTDEYHIVFSRRGSRDRNQKLRKQLEIARSRFENKLDTPPMMQVCSGKPKDYAGLQAVDYFLWAVQRLYEKQEDRYLIPLWPQCKLVQDIHDNRRHGYGEYYDKRNPWVGRKLKEGYKKPPDIGFPDRSLVTTRHGAEFCPLA